ncbi:MAG: DUF5714 domain-containing protein [Nitrospiraceae bacterium]|nr:DUF5714 domain-containing protein [Nitrospiraceae bacterium]
MSTLASQLEHCMLCGAELTYLSRAEDLTCSRCGVGFRGHVKCPEGHVLCDACHGREARKVVEEMVLAEQGTDPAEIAERLLAHPSLPMLSCDHAYVAAGALLAALRNSPYHWGTAEDMREVFERTAKQAHGGYCALTGVCGIVPALGAVLSVFLGARCGSDREQAFVMDATTRVSRAIADLTGPSCCKAYVRAAIRIAVDVFAERLAITLPLSPAPIVCSHADRHPQVCREERCPYFRRPSKDIFAESGFIPGMSACVT